MKYLLFNIAWLVLIAVKATPLEFLKFFDNDPKNCPTYDCGF